MYEISPQLETTIPFDLIVYKDAIQFHLEKCEPAEDKVKINPECFERDLKECLRVLHSLHIVHKDIKPANTLWCKRLKKFVLCDFGLSKSIKENYGEKTYT
jgi:serine/threonine protein kinase